MIYSWIRHESKIKDEVAIRGSRRLRVVVFKISSSIIVLITGSKERVVAIVEGPAVHVELVGKAGKQYRISLVILQAREQATLTQGYIAGRPGPS